MEFKKVGLLKMLNCEYTFPIRKSLLPLQFKLVLIVILLWTVLDFALIIIYII